jgi:His/Glu/Gln/Arg/opine family amino acid ABC transporter permease subunit
MGTDITSSKHLSIYFHSGVLITDLKKGYEERKEIINKIGVAIIIILLFAWMLQNETNSKYTNFFLKGVIVTLEISILAIAMGFLIGIAMGLGRVSKNFFFNGISTIYIEILRGTPLLIQIFIIYYGLPQFGIQLEPFLAGTLALGLNSGAYQAEIIRGGIQSIPKGQMEASRSTGMTYLKSMRHVILPQGFRLVIPPMTNEYITVIKDSSLAYTIGAIELTKVQSQIIPIEFDVFTTLVFTALIYFTLTFSTSTIMRVVERKFRIPGYMGVD